MQRRVAHIVAAAGIALLRERRITRVMAVVGITLLTTGTSLSAQSAASERCSAPEYRQFDFWIGDWEVVDTAGSAVGRNRITRELGGCVLREEWTGAGGVSGSSYNIYDAATGRWHQTWVDSGGTLLLLDGGLRADGAMVLEGDRPGPNGATVRNRITWSREGADTVRQLWEVTGDGTTWRVIFNGLYRRAPQADQEPVIHNGPSAHAIVPTGA